MDKNEFEGLYREKQEKIEQLLVRSLPKQVSFQKTIVDAMEYSLLAGGKRIRPMMMKEAYLLFGGEKEEVIGPFMAAMEMIHTYSLVHDDLPAMDNDDYRRGRKTTHVVYGEDMGILAGDALLNYAYETAAGAFLEGGDLSRAAKAMQILTEKAGIYGMVGGQVVDVERTGKPLEPQVLDFIYQLKTGALIEASLMIGATLGGAGDSEIQAMEQIGRCVGMAFQIQDDILDCTSTTQELGKPVHSDERNEKTTYVSLYGMEKASEAVQEYSRKAISLLETLPGTNEYLSALIEQLIFRKK